MNRKFRKSPEVFEEEPMIQTEPTCTLDPDSPTPSVPTTPMRTRPTRSTRLPAKFNDFVM